MKGLYEAGLLLKSLNFTFSVLIAKVEGVANIKNFRPINLVESIYNFIAKMLSRRMIKVMGNAVGECQHVFVKKKNK